MLATGGAQDQASIGIFRLRTQGKSPSRSLGDWGWGFHLRNSDATKQSRYEPFRLQLVSAIAQAAKRMLGEPTTPPFSCAAFISSEPSQVRALATSATSWRIT